MLKKASSFKQGQFNFNELNKQKQLAGPDANKPPQPQVVPKEKFNPNTLVTQFQDASINSPANIELTQQVGNQMEVDPAPPQTTLITTKIITAAAAMRPVSRNNNLLNDSLDMLE